MKRYGIEITQTTKCGKYAISGQLPSGKTVTFWEVDKNGTSSNITYPPLSTLTKRLKAGSVLIKGQDAAWPHIWAPNEPDDDEVNYDLIPEPHYDYYDYYTGYDYN